MIPVFLLHPLPLILFNLLNAGGGGVLAGGFLSSSMHAAAAAAVHSHSTRCRELFALEDELSSESS
jgi:hypothetical protein